jgi:hypothetical protein
MIRAFVHDVVFPQHPSWTQVSAGPFLANEASWRALARAGFRVLADYADDDGTCRVMVIDRPATVADSAPTRGTSAYETSETRRRGGRL